RSRTRDSHTRMDGPGWTVPGWKGLGETTMGMFGRGSRRLRGGRLLLLAATALLVAGCGSGSGSGQAAPATSAAAPAASTTSPATGGTGTEGVLAPPERASTAFTYNPALAPEGATIKVGVDAHGSSTEVRLDVDGLLPSRGY